MSSWKDIVLYQFLQESVPELPAYSEILDKIRNSALLPPTIVFCGFYKM